MNDHETAEKIREEVKAVLEKYGYKDIGVFSRSSNNKTLVFVYGDSRQIALAFCQAREHDEKINFIFEAAEYAWQKEKEKKNEPKD